MKKVDIELKKIKEEVLSCKKCFLYKNRKFPVIGEGNHEAKIMFTGEAPGANEDKTGRPFCGASGRVLDELLESISLRREDVYIANIIKCRPPNNRDPKPEEIKECSHFLERQIKLINPKIICPLGRYASYFIFNLFGIESESIGKIHGKIFKKDNFKIIPLYHPAVAVYNANMKEDLKKDFRNLLNNP